MATHLLLQPQPGATLDTVEIPAGRPVKIGRRPHCDVRLDDPSVSREHAVIEGRDGDWFVTDLGSKSGTMLAGHRIEPGFPVILRAGDQVCIGALVFRAVLPGTDAPPTCERHESDSPAPGAPAQHTHATNPSIFLRLRADETASRDLTWHEFHARYAPVVAGFARNMGLRAQEIDDVVQDVMLAFFRVASDFAYDPARGRFRGYLKRITRQRVAAHLDRARRAGSPHDEPDAGQEAYIDAVWRRVWAEQLFARALEEVRDRFDARTFEAFELFALRDVPADEVARRFDMPVNGVHSAKSRVLKAAREVVERLEAEEG